MAAHMPINDLFCSGVAIFGSLLGLGEVGDVVGFSNPRKSVDTDNLTTWLLTALVEDVVELSELGSK